MRVRLDVVVSLLRDAAVDILTILIVRVNHVAELTSLLLVTLNEQLHSGKATTRSGILVVLVHTHTSCGVDAWANLKYNVVDSDRLALQATDLDYRPKARRRHTVQTLQAIVGKDTVLARKRYDVGRNTYHEQVQQMLDLLERDTVLLCIGLHEFESYATT